MKFYSTNSTSKLVDLKTAVLEGLPKDSGLYMPTQIPILSSKELEDLCKRSFQEISLLIASKFFNDDLSSDLIEKTVYESITFDAPLVNIYDNIYSLELFHGPTLAFKDFAARFMARLMSSFVKEDKKELKVIVATSGDTGSAVANSFYGIDNIQVIILYPSGKISKIQEQQIATLDKNIKALEVNGTFDDCQKLVKTALADKDLNKKINLSSANSINIARLLPQTFYYFRAWSQLDKKKKDNVVISVPSGNFGNLCAGLIAKKMGLPIKKFIASTNINDIVPQYLTTGTYTAKASRQTISNAMDVGDPSNFIRIKELYGNIFDDIKKDIVGFSFTDDQTRVNIKDTYKKYSYILDPHGSVGMLGLKKYIRGNEETSAGIFFETAHPAKFMETVEKEIGQKVLIPERLAAFMNKEKRSIKINNDYKELMKHLI